MAETANRGQATSQRVLSCIQCQQRKIKCERKFPCKTCVKANVTCVPGSLVVRPRRKRFPERELLDRLRRYEALLRENDIDFDPMHGSRSPRLPTKDAKQASESPGSTHSADVTSARDDSYADGASQTTSILPETKNFWNVISDGNANFLRTALRRNEREEYTDGESDDDSDVSAGALRERAIKRAWDDSYRSGEHLLFGFKHTKIDLLTLHPDPAKILRLWHYFTENVNSLIRVVHVPSFSARILEAASDLTKIDAPMETMMFSIYCIAVQSLTEEQCFQAFGETRADLLDRYRIGGQQALLNASVLRSYDRDCLTSLFLYLVTTRPETDPRSISAMMGIAMRIAHRMMLQSEASLAKCTPFEAEMRRRLWWALVLFDTRISEMSDYKGVTLVPLWDCKPPLNVNDFDLRPDMKKPPPVDAKITEALYTVVRCEIGDFMRFSGFHLDFVNPALKSVAKALRQPGPDEHDVSTLERLMESKYLQHCNMDNPLHFMTVWTARGMLAKNYIIEFGWRGSRAASPPSEAERDGAMRHALSMLVCDTHLMNAPAMKAYMWLINMQFPFPAYLYLMNDLKARPGGRHVREAWREITTNYEARGLHLEPAESPFFRILARLILQAWAACRDVVQAPDQPLPLIVVDIQHRLQLKRERDQLDRALQSDGTSPLDILSSESSTTPDFLGFGYTYPNTFDFSFLGNVPATAMPGQDQGVDCLANMDWDSLQGRS